MLILIVDKEIRWASHVKKPLEDEGHQVEILEDYEKITEYTGKGKIDFIFYDFNVFKKNQKFLAQLIMQNPQIRVIVTATLPNYKDAMCAKRYGAIDYIDKLYDYDELKNIMGKNLNHIPVSRAYLEQVLNEEELCL